MVKRCNQCKLEKEEFEFYKSGTTEDGLYDRCRTCSNIRSKNYYKKHKGRCLKRTHDWYQKEAGKDPDYYAKRNKKYGYSEYGRIRNATLDGRIIKLLACAASRSQSKKMDDFDLDVEWVKSQFVAQSGKCCLTGIEFDLTHRGFRKKNPFGPSLDRIDNSRGYTKDNVRLVCTIVNMAINDFGMEAFKRMCNEFINYENSKV